jgi:hypothetical protein
LFPHTQMRDKFYADFFQPLVPISRFHVVLLPSVILFSHSLSSTPTHNPITEFCYLYTEWCSKQWLTPTGTWWPPPSKGRGWAWFCECWGRCLRFLVVYVLVSVGKCWGYAEVHQRGLPGCSTHKSKFKKYTFLDNVISNLYIKTNQTHQFLSFILFCSSILHVSGGLSVHNQESKTVRAASGIWHTGSVVQICNSKI